MQFSLPHSESSASANAEAEQVCVCARWAPGVIFYLRLLCEWRWASCLPDLWLQGPMRCSCKLYQRIGTASRSPKQSSEDISPIHGEAQNHVGQTRGKFSSFEKKNTWIAPSFPRSTDVSCMVHHTIMNIRWTRGNFFWLKKKTKELHHLTRECFPLLDICADKLTEAGVKHGQNIPSEIAGNTNWPSCSKLEELHMNG
jgi:hypothetical protein